MDIPVSNSDFIAILLEEGGLEDLKHYKKGEVIIEEGANARHVFLQKSGIIKIVKNFDRTDPIIVSFAFPNTLTGIPAVLLERKYKLTAIALEDTSGWLISASKFMTYLEHKRLEKLVFKQMTEESQILMERIGTMAQRSGKKRFLSVLIMLSEIYGTADGKKLNLNLSIKDLSEIVMLSRETMHRIIRDIEDEGIISIKSKRITFLNFEKLARMAQE